MKCFSKLISLLLVSAVLLSVAALNGCTGGLGKGDETTEAPMAAVAREDLKIGVLLPDTANAVSACHYQLKGLSAAVEAAGLDTASRLVLKKSVTDVTFDAQIPFSVKDETTAEAASSGKDGTETSAVGAAVNETALEAAASLVADGCNVIVAASELYADLTAYLAAQLPDVIFLQYGAGSVKLPNLKFYSDKAYEAFYLAGVAAATLSKDKKAGFVCGEIDAAVTDCVNAFSNGMTSVDKKSSVALASTDAKLDLVLERTLAESLIADQKCDVVAQSVLTALPQVSAEAAKVYCFGYGYDMSPDATAYNVFSVVFNWNVFFGAALNDITAGKFTAASYSGGLEDGLVGISEIRVKNDALSKAVGDAKTKIVSGEIKPLSGAPSDGGFVAAVKTV